MTEPQSKQHCAGQQNNGKKRCEIERNFLMVYVMEVPRQISFFAFATLFMLEIVPSFTINLHPLCFKDTSENKKVH